MKKLLIVCVLLSLVSCVSDNSAEHSSNAETIVIDTNTVKESTEELKYRLIQSDVAIVNQYGEDSIVTDEDGNLSFLYPAPDTIWFNTEE